MTSLDSDDVFLLGFTQECGGKIFLLSAYKGQVGAAKRLAKRRLLAWITTSYIDVGDGPCSYETFILTKRGAAALAGVSQEANS